MLARDGTHPALLTLFAQNAQKLHGGSGWFNRAREFPNSRHTELPLAKEADRAMNEPVPMLQRYLPFWLAVLVDRLIVMLIPIFALLIPLLKVAPALYTWRVRSKVFRCYGELKFLEDDLKNHFDRARLAEYRSRLDALEDEAVQLHVPLGFTDLVYTLREHVNLVRGILDKQESHS